MTNETEREETKERQKSEDESPKEGMIRFLAGFQVPSFPPFSRWETGAAQRVMKGQQY